jgi:hypothetical protein
MIQRRDDPADTLCLQCGMWWPPGHKCTHDVSAPCRKCSGPVGLRCFASVEGECWRCSAGIPLAKPITSETV